eukprot:m.249900 g.249900  ORF g.249900 m.249900 type:complete len:378 (-) comp16416_c0_seq1:97-1230(-)
MAGLGQTLVGRVWCDAAARRLVSPSSATRLRLLSGRRCLSTTPTQHAAKGSSANRPAYIAPGARLDGRAVGAPINGGVVIFSGVTGAGKTSGYNLVTNSKEKVSDKATHTTKKFTSKVVVHPFEHDIIRVKGREISRPIEYEFVDTAGLFEATVGRVVEGQLTHADAIQQLTDIMATYNGRIVLLVHVSNPTLFRTGNDAAAFDMMYSGFGQRKIPVIGLITKAESSMNPLNWMEANRELIDWNFYPFKTIVSGTVAQEHDIGEGMWTPRWQEIQQKTLHNLWKAIRAHSLREGKHLHPKGMQSFRQVIEAKLQIWVELLTKLYRNLRVNEKLAWEAIKKVSKELWETFSDSDEGGPGPSSRPPYDPSRKEFDDSDD